MAQQLYFRIKAAQTYRVAFALAFSLSLSHSFFPFLSLFSPFNCLFFSHALCFGSVVICIKGCAENCAAIFVVLTMCVYIK